MLLSPSRSRSRARTPASFTVASEQRYKADRPAWAALLGCTPDTLPSDRDWPQLLGALIRILRWSSRPELATMSDYLLASNARDLLEDVRPDLAFAGIPVDLSPSPDSRPPTPRNPGQINDAIKPGEDQYG